MQIFLLEKPSTLVIVLVFRKNTFLIIFLEKKNGKFKKNQTGSAKENLFLLAGIRVGKEFSSGPDESLTVTGYKSVTTYLSRFIKFQKAVLGEKAVRIRWWYFTNFTQHTLLSDDLGITLVFEFRFLSS